MQPAPLYTDVAEAPAGGEAFWLTASDGVRIRVAHWTGPGVRGTMLMFPGRTEYIEKYGRFAAEMLARGLRDLAVDWRGQGIADRLDTDRGLGHVGQFSDYQRDVAAVVAFARARNLPQPWYLVGHSMGGCIGLRALIDGLPVKAVMFSAPMWGILMSRPVRPFAWALSTVTSGLGVGNRVAPGESTTSYRGPFDFATNELTTDPEMYDYMNRQVTAHPDLGLGGPSLKWLNEALWEMRRLAALPAPATPALTYLGTAETIVDPARIHAKMKVWPNGKLVVVPGAKHELIMEIPAIRNEVCDATAAHFDANR